MSRRWQPKRWPTPRKRNDPRDVIDSTLVLKAHWPQGHEHPPWAKLAFERGWMSAEAFYNLPLSEKVWTGTGRIPKDIIEKSPFWSLIRKPEVWL